MKNKLCHCDDDYNKYVVVDKESNKNVTNVIFALPEKKCVKRWKNGRDHTRGTEFIEGISIKIKIKEKKK
jgi:hypothetical protein